jgi:hypothetical protein
VLIAVVVAAVVVRGARFCVGGRWRCIDGAYRFQAKWMKRGRRFLRNRVRRFGVVVVVARATRSVRVVGASR